MVLKSIWKDHRIIEWPRLEGTSRIMEATTSPPQAGPSTSTFNPRPGCPGPHLTWPWTPPGMRYPQPLWAVIYPFKELTPLLFVGSLQVLKGCNEVTLQPSFLQAEQAQLPQPVFVGEVLQPSDHLCGPPLDPLQQLLICSLPFEAFSLMDSEQMGTSAMQSEIFLQFPIFVHIAAKT